MPRGRYCSSLGPLPFGGYSGGLCEFGYRSRAERSGVAVTNGQRRCGGDTNSSPPQWAKLPPARRSLPVPVFPRPAIFFSPLPTVHTTSRRNPDHEDSHRFRRRDFSPLGPLRIRGCPTRLHLRDGLVLSYSQNLPNVWLRCQDGRRADKSLLSGLYL